MIARPPLPHDFLRLSSKRCSFRPSTNDHSDPESDMAGGPAAVTVHCLPFREYFSSTNLKSMIRGFVYEYETPKIVTIHSIFQCVLLGHASRISICSFLFLVALMCRLIQLLILVYGIVYLMIHKKGYQETDTSIISSITLKVKVSALASLFFHHVCFLHQGIGYNQTGQNQTLVIDGAGNELADPISHWICLSLADYIVPPQENNALFLMTNFIRTDQEHKRCAGR